MSMMNSITFNQSMNGIITLSDGMGTIIENGQVNTLNLAVNGYGAIGESFAIGDSLAVGNNIVNSGNIICAKTVQSDKQKTNLLTSGNIAISGYGVFTDSIGVCEDLAVGNNIVNSGSIICSKKVQCDVLQTNNLMMNNATIRYDTQAQIDRINEILTRNNIF